MSRNGKIIIGLLSLVGVLLYNWTHTGGLLASYVKPEFVGYIAAAGIELAVVGLSLRIDEMRRAQADATFHVATLAAVVIVSALANIAQGYLVKFGTELTSANIGRLDAVQVVVSLAATGLLSLVVFALAEVVGHDIGASEAQPTASPAQPIAQGQQVDETDEIGPLGDDAGQDTALESSHMPLGSVSSVSVPESALTTVITKSPLESPVLSTVSFDDYQLTGDTRADLRALLVLAPLATNASLARKLNKSSQRVSQLRASLAQEAQGVTR